MNTKSNRSFLGSGWSFPIAFSAGDLCLSLTKNEENINEAIDLILNTKMGERTMDKEFGSGLQLYVFRTRDESLKAEIRETVMTSLLINEPRITVEDVIVKYDPNDLGKVNIIIQYIYNRVNTRYNYVFPFSINEGTN